MKCGIYFANSYLSLYSVWIWYTNYIHNFYDVYTFFVDQNWLYKMYIYKMCVCKMYPTFWQTFVYILYTKFSCQSSFNFVYKMYIYKSLLECGNILYIFCIHQLQLYILYNFCIQNVYIHSFHVGIHRHLNIIFFFE